MKGKIVVLLVGMALLVGMLSGCTEQPTVEANTAPVANFEWTPEMPVAGETVQFTDTSTDENADDTLIYTWDFGDESAASSEKDPAHIYAENNTYTAKLTVSDGTDTDSISKVINVGVQITNNEAPIANFTSVPDNLTVTFTDSSTDDGNISAWSWDFDNDGTAENTTEGPVTYTYAAAGSYNVTLTVTDDDATTPLTGTVTKEITVTSET